MKKVVLVASIFLVLIGCAITKETVRLYREGVVYPPTQPEKVEVFQKKPSGRNFIEFGEITVEYAEDWDHVEKIFKKKAAELGADAVYVYNKESVEKNYYSPPPVRCPGYYDYYGYHYFYGPHHFGYRYCYPDGFYTSSLSLINATGIMIKYREEQGVVK